MIKEERAKLYNNIVEKHKSGLIPAEIAKLYDITRSRVYQILKSKGITPNKKFDK